MPLTRVPGQQVEDASIELVDLAAEVTNLINSKATSSSLAPIATSGSYNDLADKPTLFSGSYNDLTNKPTLGSLSGSLDDLSDVTITTPSNTQVLQYNGTAWVNNTLSGLLTNTAQDFYGVKTFIHQDGGGGGGAGGEIRIGNPSFMTWARNYYSLINTSGWLDLVPISGNRIVRFRTPGDTFNNWNLFIECTRDIAFPRFDLGTDSFAGGPVATINITNTLGVGLTASIGSRFQVNTGTAATKGIIVRGSASQTANLFEVQNSSSQINCAINDGGSITTAGEITVRGSGVSRFNSLLTTGGGVGGSLTNRGFTMLHQVAAETQMDFMTTADASTTLSESMMCFNLVQNQIGFNTIRTSIDGQVHITTKAAARKALVVRGAASQTANLLEIQNSSGTGLFVIDSAGAISLPTTSPLVIKGNSGHTWNNTLMRVTDSASSANYFTIYGNGRMRMGTNDAPTSQGGDLLGTSNYSLTVNSLSTGDGALCIQHATNNVNPLILASTPSGVALNVSQYGMYIKNLTAGYTPLRVDSVAGAANLMDVKSNGASKFVVDTTGSITTGIVPVARVTGLHAVATSGSYNDLSDKPSIPSIAGLATETYVDNAVAAVVNSAPAVLDTLNELAAALDDDPNFATTMTTALAAKADSSSLAAVATSGSYVDLSNKPTIYTPVKEVFTSLVDGVETEFVLSDAPAVAGTEQVFVNGILQSAGASDDYTISSDTITFNTAPEAGWKLVVYYFI